MTVRLAVPITTEVSVAVVAMDVDVVRTAKMQE